MYLLAKLDIIRDIDKDKNISYKTGCTFVEYPLQERIPLEELHLHGEVVTSFVRNGDVFLLLEHFNKIEIKNE